MLAKLPKPDSMPGIIFNQILNSTESQSVADIAPVLSSMGINKPSKDISGALLALFNKDLIRRKKVDGHFRYIIPNANPGNTGQQLVRKVGAEKGKPRGEQIARTIDLFKKNIGRPMTIKQIVEESGGNMNSAVHVRLTKLAKQGYITKEQSGYGRGMVYTALPTIENYGSIKSPTQQSLEITPPNHPLHQPVHQPAIVPESGPNDLVTLMQGLIEQQSQNEKYKQALFQIAALLESIGIIEGAE